MTDDQDFAQNIDGIRLKPRVFDFITVEGLQTLTGLTTDNFIVFMTKELIDNALDKEGVKEIRVKISEEYGVLTLLVSDDGHPTFNRSMLNKVLGFEKAPSSKRGLKTIRRGVLGNALQCCFGISYAMWNEKRPLYTAEVIGEKRFLISIQPGEESIQTKISEEEYDNNGITTLSFKLPLHNYSSPFAAVQIIALLNPHVTIHYEEKGVSRTFKARTEKPPPRYETDIYWYSSEEFQSLVDGVKDMTVEKFVTLFRKVRHRLYAKAVLKAVNIEPRRRLRDLSREQVQRLYETLRRQVGKPAGPSQLPRLGKTFFENFENFKLVRYMVKEGVWNDGTKLIPFVVEAASFRSRGESGNIFEAINFTASIHNPFSRLAFDAGGRLQSLYDLMTGKGLDVFIHVVCPSTVWLDPAKGNFSMEPFMIEKEVEGKVLREYIIATLVKSVCRRTTEPGFDYETLVYLTNGIMASYPKDTSFTLRQIFYRLVALYMYPNTRQTYNRLGKVLVKAREESLVDGDRIVDLSRPEYMNNPSHSSFSKKVNADISMLIEKFDLDRWGMQPSYVECWIEKEALSRVIDPICRRYRVNLVVGRGYSSYTQIRRAVHRFPENKKIVILYLGDHDPPGLHIQEKLKERFLKEAERLGKKLNIEVKRIALTYEQIEQYSLPPSPLKRLGQKWKEYQEVYGDKVWELDALDPNILMNITENKIRKLIDWQIWNKREREVEQYRQLLHKKTRILLKNVLHNT